MHFCLVDRVLERTAGSIVTIKLVSAGEEYLRDHFPTFPVLPGVLMLEAMVQAGRALIDPDGSAPAPMVLAQVRALKYGRFVKPGDTLRVSVTLVARGPEGSGDFKGEARVLSPEADPREEPPVACSGRFTLRAARIGGVPGGAGVAEPGASV